MAYKAIKVQHGVNGMEWSSNVNTWLGRVFFT